MANIPKIWVRKELGSSKAYMLHKGTGEPVSLTEIPMDSKMTGKSDDYIELYFEEPVNEIFIRISDCTLTNSLQLKWIAEAQRYRIQLPQNSSPLPNDESVTVTIGEGEGNSNQ